MAQVELSPAAVKMLAACPEPIIERVYDILQRLEHWPAVSGVKPLKRNWRGWFRIRTGDYRIRFRVEGERVIVDKIGHRRDFYEDC